MPDEYRSSRRQVVVGAVVVEGGMALLAWLLASLLGISLFGQIHWTDGGAALGLFAALPLVVALLLMTHWPVGPLAGLDDLVRRSIVPLFRECTPVDLLLICALAGIGEELLFRGLAQTGLERAVGRPWLAVVAAGVLFGVAHPITPIYAVLAGLIGVYLGAWYLATGNLLVPIIAHAAYDLAALLYLLRDKQTPPCPEVASAGHGDEWSI